MIGEVTGKMLETVRADVRDCLGSDSSGHDMSHIERVEALTTQFAGQENLSNEDVMLAQAAALLHDVDDYKLVGKENADALTNATKIMEHAGFDDEMIIPVKGIIASIGYSKALKGVRPNTLPGKIVSDADMCDAIGANGIVRSIVYAVSDKGNGVIFDKNKKPIANMTAEQYNSNGTTHDTDSAINHFFEKLLRLKGMMLTESGKREAERRDAVMVTFLRQYFNEQNLPDWQRYLESFLIKRSLDEAGINYNTWGKGEAKTFEHLVDEVMAGE